MLLINPSKQRQFLTGLNDAANLILPASHLDLHYYKRPQHPVPISIPFIGLKHLSLLTLSSSSSTLPISNGDTCDKASELNVPASIGVGTAAVVVQGAFVGFARTDTSGRTAIPSTVTI